MKLVCLFVCYTRVNEYLYFLIATNLLLNLITPRISNNYCKCPYTKGGTIGPLVTPTGLFGSFWNRN